MAHSPQAHFPLSLWPQERFSPGAPHHRNWAPERQLHRHLAGIPFLHVSLPALFRVRKLRDNSLFPTSCLFPHSLQSTEKDGLCLWVFSYLSHLGPQSSRPSHIHGGSPQPELILSINPFTEITSSWFYWFIMCFSRQSILIITHDFHRHHKISSSKIVCREEYMSVLVITWS